MLKPYVSLYNNSNRPMKKAFSGNNISSLDRNCEEKQNNYLKKSKSTNALPIFDYDKIPISTAFTQELVCQQSQKGRVINDDDINYEAALCLSSPPEFEFNDKSDNNRMKELQNKENFERILNICRCRRKRIRLFKNNLNKDE